MNRDELIRRHGVFATLFGSLDHQKCHDLWIELGNQFAAGEMVFHFASNTNGPGYVVRVSQATPDEYEQVKLFVSGFLQGWRRHEFRNP